MLILTRRSKETIVIGENGEIQVTILGVKGNQVRIGVLAPETCPIHRQELANRIAQEQKEITGRPTLRLPHHA